MPSPVLPWDSGLSRVQMCMRLGLNQTKNGFRSRFARSMKVDRGLEELLIDRLHALLGERPGVLALLLAPGAEALIVARRVGGGGDAFENAAWTELRAESRILRIVRMLGLILGVEVIEVAEKLVEAMHGRQELVAVAEMVLAELSGRVALRLEQLGNRRVLRRQSLLGPGQSHFQEAGAQRTLPGDECGAAGGARLLAVVIGEDRAFGGDAVDVGRAVAHHAAVVGADVPVADIVAHNDENVRFLLLREGRGRRRHGGKRREQANVDASDDTHDRSISVHEQGMTCSIVCTTR